MKTVPTAKLSQEGCDIIVNAAIEKAQELKQIGSICVVDAGAHLMAFKRMTNGRTHNTLIAQAKARCAASAFTVLIDLFVSFLTLKSGQMW